MFKTRLSDIENPTKNDKIVLRDSFAETVNYTFYHTGLGGITTVQYWICVYLQNTLTQKDVIIEQFRGIGKSLITSIFVMWLLLRHRDLKILVISGSSDKAKNFVRYCYTLMHNVGIFQSLLVERRKGERTSVSSFDVYGAKPAQDPSVRSLGILGTITSLRANVIIVDDAETKKNARTVAGRELLYEITTEFRALLTAGALNNIIYLGTRHHIQSMYNRIREERGYKHLICPVRYPADKKELEDYKGLLAPHIYRDLKEKNCWGLPTDERFNDEVIEDTKKQMGKTAFEMQMLLKADSASILYPIWFKEVYFMEFAPKRVISHFEPHQYQIENTPHQAIRDDDYIRTVRGVQALDMANYTIMAIDPSGRGADLFAYSIISVTMGRYWVHDIKGLQGGYKEENLTYILSVAKQHGVNKIYIEDNFGDGAVTVLLKKRMIEIGIHIGIEEIKAYKNKIDRIIEAIEPIFNQGLIVFNSKILENDISCERVHSFFTQATNIISGVELEHDDKLDSFALGMEQLKKTASMSEYRAKEDFIKKEKANAMYNKLKDKFPKKRKPNFRRNY